MDKKPLKPEEGAMMLEPDIRKYFPAKAKSHLNSGLKGGK
jgi:hypothetical protein